MRFICRVFVLFKVEFNDVLKEVGFWFVEFVFLLVILGFNCFFLVMLGEIVF